MPVCYLYFSLISLSNNAIHKFSDYRLNTISDRQDVATPLRAYCRPDERANTVRHCLQSVILISEQQTDNQQLYSINILQTREKYRESVKATNYINRSSSEILHTSNENRHLRYLRHLRHLTSRHTEEMLIFRKVIPEIFVILQPD